MSILADDLDELLERTPASGFLSLASAAALLALTLSPPSYGGFIWLPVWLMAVVVGTATALGVMFQPFAPARGVAIFALNLILVTVLCPFFTGAPPEAEWLETAVPMALLGWAMARAVISFRRARRASTVLAASVSAMAAIAPLSVPPTGMMILAWRAQGSSEDQVMFCPFVVATTIAIAITWMMPRLAKGLRDNDISVSSLCVLALSELVVGVALASFALLFSLGASVRLRSPAPQYPLVLLEHARLLLLLAALLLIQGGMLLQRRLVDAAAGAPGSIG